MGNVYNKDNKTKTDKAQKLNLKIEENQYKIQN